METVHVAFWYVPVGICPAAMVGRSGHACHCGRPKGHDGDCQCRDCGVRF